MLMFHTVAETHVLVPVAAPAQVVAKKAVQVIAIADVMEHVKKPATAIVKVLIIR